ncbi:MAG: nucleotidyltransferase domain-containing protein [Deltaproteobacteria bacterium]|nr:nucleotidyltransferase domain-containing protein [Deltaproteobacteria bacterium]
MAQKISDVEETIKAYIKELESKGIHVEKAILFGSYATGNAHSDSDIDLVVISRDLKKFDFPERLSFLSKATLHVPGPLEVFGYTPDEVYGKEGKSIFWDEIRLTGREIHKAA